MVTNGQIQSDGDGGFHKENLPKVWNLLTKV